MKKTVLVLCSFIVLATTSSIAQQKTAVKGMKSTVKKEQKNVLKTANILDFVVVDIDGNKFDFATLKGKKVMIVNTASECGLTPQYGELETLYQKFKDTDLVIIGFPSNDFNGQEPGDNKTIRAFCQKNYGVSFPMMSKISVQGEKMSPVYQFLTQKEKNGVADSKVEWNFQKYLIGRDGRLEKVISPKVSPLSDEIVDWAASK